MTDSIINKEIGAWLLVNGNTQDKLAEVIGLTRPTLATRIDGDSDWKWSEVCKLADLFSCSTEHFRQ